MCGVFLTIEKDCDSICMPYIGVEKGMLMQFVRIVSILGKQWIMVAGRGRYCP